MAEIRVPHDDFTLTASWNCSTVYRYEIATGGKYLGSTNTTSDLTYPTKTVRFPVNLPTGAKVQSAKVFASHTTGLFGGKLHIAGIGLSDDGFVTLESPDFSAGYVDIEFQWNAYTDGAGGHSSNPPAYNGSTSQTRSNSHQSPTTVSDIYLLIEYENSGIIYRAENGVLVPYKLYHAEGGALVPYLLRYAEDGALVPYG